MLNFIKHSRMIVVASVTLAALLIVEFAVNRENGDWKVIDWGY